VDLRQLQALLNKPLEQSSEPVTQVVVRFDAEVEDLAEELYLTTIEEIVRVFYVRAAGRFSSVMSRLQSHPFLNVH
jgi:hypothetical protein